MRYTMYFVVYKLKGRHPYEDMRCFDSGKGSLFVVSPFTTNNTLCLLFPLLDTKRCVTI